MKHTPERCSGSWVYLRPDGETPDGIWFDCPNCKSFLVTWSEIEACVNACAGIKNPEGVPMMKEALETIVNAGAWYYSALEIDVYEGHDGEKLEKMARAALAKLEERAE
jgi:hypothetical protein